MVARLKKILAPIIAWTMAVWIPALCYAQDSGVTGQIKPVVLAPTAGLQTNTADLLRDKSFAKVLNNLQMTKRGIWTSRGIGWTPQRAGTFNSGTAFLEMAQHYEAAGTSRFVMQVAGKIYSYDLGTSTETEIGTGANTTAIPCMRSYSSTVFIWVNGQEEPRNWNGNPASAMTSPAGWPPTVAGTSYSKPSIVETYYTRACYAGFPSYPYTVLMSAANLPNAFTISTPLVATDGGAFTLPSALGPIVGMRTLRLANLTNDQVLVIGCERGIAFIGGTDATNFYQRELTRTYGLLSNRSWCQLQNDLYFAATDGLRSLSNLNTAATLSPDTLSFGLNNLWSRINTTYKGKIFAVHHPSTQEVWFWLPIDAYTTCKNAIVLNYNTGRNSDGTIAPVFSTRDGIESACAIDYNGTMYAGGVGATVGLLQTYYSGDTNNGSLISWCFMPAFVETNAQNPLQSSSSKRFLILTEGGNQAFTCEAWGLDTLSTGDSRFSLFFTQRKSVTAASVTDTSTWAAAATTTTYPHIIEFDPPGSARYWTLRIYAAQASDHINLVAVEQLQLVGGLKQ